MAVEVAPVILPYLVPLNSQAKVYQEVAVVVSIVTAFISTINIISYARRFLSFYIRSIGSCFIRLKLLGFQS